MRILWASHIVPYPPKSGVHLRTFNLLRATCMRNEVDLVAFIQEPWLRIFYPSRAEALEDCARHLRDICRSVRFVEIDNLTRPLGKYRTALKGLLCAGGYTARWLRSDLALKIFRDIALRGDYDLAHFDTLSLAPFQKLFHRIPANSGPSQRRVSYSEP